MSEPQAGTTLRAGEPDEPRAVELLAGGAGEVALPIAGAVVTAGSAADMVVSAVEQGLDVMRSALAQVKAGAGPMSGADFRETIALVLAESGGYDCAVLWRVDGLVLVPASVAFAPRIKPSVRELERLVSDPPQLHEYGLEAALVSDAEVAATGSLGSGGPMERVLGPLSYAIAAVKSGSYPAFLLQAIYCERRAGQFDLDLLMSVAQLVAALDVEPEAAERRSQGRGQAGANTQDTLAARLSMITSREREVLDHALTGATYSTIADALFISVATVHSHMQSIRRKLGVHSRAELIAQYGRRDHDSLLRRIGQRNSTDG